MSDFATINSNKDQELFDKGFKYFCQELGITQEQRDFIEFSVVQRLAGAGGQCLGTYHASTNKLLALKIKIVSYPSVMGMLDVLAHELVHARQHFNNEFKHILVEKPFLFFWKTTEWVRTHKGQILEETPYFEMKCEQEAFTKARELMLGFMKHIASTDSIKQLDINNEVEGAQIEEQQSN